MILIYFFNYYKTITILFYNDSNIIIQIGFFVNNLTLLSMNQGKCNVYRYVLKDIILANILETKQKIKSADDNIIEFI